jgi:hypothetical protein
LREGKGREAEDISGLYAGQVDGEMTVAWVYRKIILTRINLCINIHFLNFNLNIRYIFNAYWIRDTTPARHISLMYHERMEKAQYFIK